MARKHRDEPLEEASLAADEQVPGFDTTFEEAQQMLQDAVAQIRAWEPPPDYAEAHGTGDELGAHRRWRRRMHTGEHAIVDPAEVDSATDVASGHDATDADLLDEVAVGQVGETAAPEIDEIDEIDQIDQIDQIEATPLPIDGAETPDPVEVVAVGAEAAGVEAVEAVEAVEVEAPEEAEALEVEAVDVDAVEADAIVEVEAPEAPEAEASETVEDPDAVPATAEVDVVAVAAVVDESAADWDQTEPPVPEGAHGRRRRSRAPAAAAGVAAITAAGGTADAAAGDDLAGLGATYEKRTPRRRRERSGHQATIDSPTADYVLTMDTIEPLPASEAAASPAPNRSRRLLLVAAVVAGLVVAGIGVALVAGGGDDEVASPPANVKPRLEFPAETTPDGIEVQRVWELQGAKGTNFTGTLEFTNPTSAPVTAKYTEIIPKALASSVTDIRFTPQPVVLKADPVVQWTETVQPGESFTATYEVTVEADGATRQRLLKWQEDRDAEVATTTTTTLPPTPTTEAPTTTTPVNTSPPSATAAPPVTAPTTTTAPPPPPTTAPPPPGGFIWMSVFNDGTAGGTFNFSNGVSLTVPAGGQQSSALISVPAGAHSVTLTNGTTTAITCSGHGSGSGSTANYDVGPSETAGCTWTATP